VKGLLPVCRQAEQDTLTVGSLDVR
jgi:hypothetical protein